MLQRLGAKPRVLEIGCGPVPLLALSSARLGARAWAVEMLPELQELAVETVRDSGFEMVFQYKGYSNYSFFDKPKNPEDPSVRVVPAMPSTSLQVGITPKLLDGLCAHCVACAPDDGLLGEDYLETMWHAAEQLLEPGGALLPPALLVRAAPVEWLPFGASAAPLLHGQLCAGSSIQALPSDRLLPLSTGTASRALRIDLSIRPEGGALPSAEGTLTMGRAGLLTAVAFWHEADFDAEEGAAGTVGEGEICPHAWASFLRRPRQVVAGETLHFRLAFADRELRLSISED